MGYANLLQRPKIVGRIFNRVVRDTVLLEEPVDLHPRSEAEEFPYLLHRQTALAIRVGGRLLQKRTSGIAACRYKVLREAIDPAHDWEQQVERALSAYLGCMAANPVLLRTLFVEILGLGAAGLAARRRVNQEVAEYMLAVVNAGHPTTRLTPELAMAVVGGIHELVLQAIEQGEVEQLERLTPTAASLVKAVVHR